MNHKLVLGWLLVCLGFASIGTGWLLTGRVQAAYPGEPNAAEVPGWPPGAAGAAVDEAPTSFAADDRLADEGLIRIHVIANSDDEADQTLKLKVRDAVLDYLKPQLANSASTPEAEQAIAAALDALEVQAASVIAREGFDYAVRADLGRYDFPGKAYGTLYLPAGRYKALRIIIGQGEGANFWCLVYPSFCYTIREVGGPAASAAQRTPVKPVVTAKAPNGADATRQVATKSLTDTRPTAAKPVTDTQPAGTARSLTDTRPSKSLTDTKPATTAKSPTDFSPTAGMGASSQLMRFAPGATRVVSGPVDTHLLGGLEPGDVPSTPFCPGAMPW